MVYSVAHEMANVWKTVEEVDKQRRHQPQLRQKTSSQVPKKLTPTTPAAAAAPAASSNTSSTTKPHKPGPKYAGCFICGDKGH